MAYTYSKISSVTVGSGGLSSINFIAIPQTYTDLVLKTSNRVTDFTNGYEIFVNGQSGSYRFLYGGSGLVGSGTGSYILGLTITSSFTANVFTNGEVYIPNYTSSNIKTISSDEVQENNNSGSGSTYMYLIANLVTNQSPITQIQIVPRSGGVAFAQYSTFTLYGIKAEV